MYNAYMSDIARSSNEYNELEWCFQSQVYNYAFLAARMHLRKRDWDRWIEMSNEEKLVRAPLFRGTLHTLPISVYQGIAKTIRPVIERVIKSNQARRYGVERVEEVWESTTDVLAEEERVDIDYLVDSLALNFPEIRNSDLKYLVRSSPETVEIANGDKRLKRVTVTNDAMDCNSLFVLYHQLFSGLKRDFIKWSGFLNKEVSINLSTGKSMHGDNTVRSVLFTPKRGVVVLPPFDPFLLAYAKDTRLLYIDNEHYNLVWGRSGVVYGAIIKNERIVGRLKVASSNAYVIDAWEKLEKRDIEEIENSISLMNEYLGGKPFLEVNYIA